MTKDPKAVELADELERLAERATDRPWQLQDGCSWRRIGTPDRSGSVLSPTTYSSTDKHPDLIAEGGNDLYANLKLIVALANNLPAILTALRGSVPGRDEVLEEAAKVADDWAAKSRETARRSYRHPMQGLAEQDYDAMGDEAIACAQEIEAFAAHLRSLKSPAPSEDQGEG